MLKNNNFLLIVLRGVGQIMLQENAITGLVFLIGIFIGSISMGIAALLATITGTLTAKLLKYDEFEIQSGLYGFSPALVGVALALFFKPVFIVWLAIVIGSILAALLQHYFIQKKIPAFTFPFVLVTWILAYVFHQIYPLSSPETLADTEIKVDYFQFIFKGYGQVIFQDKLIVGILFFLGVLINSRIAGFYGILGSVLGAIFAYLFSAPLESIALGLMGYNGVLCAIVFSGKKIHNFLWSSLAVFISVLISLGFMKYQLTALTFPFVAASILVIWIRKVVNNI